MTEKEVRDIERVARAEAKRTVEKLQREKESQKEKDTREIMRSYRDALFHLENINTEETDADGELLDRIESANISTRIMVRNVNRALREIERRRKADGRQQEYRAFELYYLKGLTLERTAEQLEKETGQIIGRVTPKRWCDGIIKELSTLLWGL